MATVNLDIPEDLLQALGGTPEAVGRELRLTLALLLCHRGRISTGRAVRLAGVSYAEFLDASVRYDVSLFDVDVEELKQELGRPLPEGVDVEAIKEDLERAQSARG